MITIVNYDCTTFIVQASGHTAEKLSKTILSFSFFSLSFPSLCALSVSFFFLYTNYLSPFLSPSLLSLPFVPLSLSLSYLSPSSLFLLSLTHYSLFFLSLSLFISSIHLSHLSFFFLYKNYLPSFLSPSLISLPSVPLPLSLSYLSPSSLFLLPLSLYLFLISLSTCLPLIELSLLPSHSIVTLFSFVQTTIPFSILSASSSLYSFPPLSLPLPLPPTSLSHDPISTYISRYFFKLQVSAATSSRKHLLATPFPGLHDASPNYLRPLLRPPRRGDNLIKRFASSPGVS